MIKVSCIIPFHSDLTLLQSACVSISKQVLPPDFSLEVIISNDSSYSPSFITSHLLSIFSPDINFLVTNNPASKGAGPNRNNALSFSTGSYIAFLDADDSWHPLKLYFQLTYLLQGYNFVSSAYSYECGKIIFPPLSFRSPTSLFFSSRPLGTSTIVISRELLGSSVFSDLTFCQDLVFWHTLLSKPICSYHAIPLALSHYSDKAGRTSNSGIYTLLRYYLKACRLSGLSHPFSFLSVLVYLCRGFINKFFTPCTALFSSTFTPSIRSLFRKLAFPFLYLLNSSFFDVLNSTETSMRRRFGLSYAPFYADSIHYVASNTDILRIIFSEYLIVVRALGISPCSFQFVDLGCGKGKSLCVIVSFSPKHLLLSFNRN